MSPACSPVCPGITRATFCIFLLSGLCLCLQQYFFIDEPKTWHEAVSYCREKYGDLASINNQADVARLIEAVGSGYQGEVWIGLYDAPDSWGWVLSDPDMYEEGEWNFRRWNRGEPNDVRPRGILCVVMRGYSSTYWFDTSCSVPYAFVCYNNTLDNSSSIQRHFLINEKRDWNNARNYCRQYYTDLASVRNEEEQALIQDLLAVDQLALIGLYRYTWTRWSDSLSTTFENWAYRYPRSLTENCAATVFNATQLGKWVGNDCAKKINFVCQSNKKRVFHIKLTALKSTIDLNDPAVTEAALNLIEKKMNETGIGKHLKISWVKKPDNSIFNKEEKKTDVVT